MSSIIPILARLGDHQHIQREKATSELCSLQTLSEEERQLCFAHLDEMSKSKRWEDRYGSIKGLISLLTMHPSCKDVKESVWPSLEKF
jgi:hypothetical protein